VFSRRQDGSVLGRHDFVGKSLESVSRDGFVLLGTENQANGGIFSLSHPLLTGRIEIDAHLAGVGVGKLADLQIDDYQTPQTTVEEEEVNTIPLVADAQALLPGNEAEISSKLQEKGLQVPDKRLFQLAFGVLVLEAKEFQDIRVLDLFRRPDRVFYQGFCPLLSIAALFRDRAVRS